MRRIKRIVAGVVIMSFCFSNIVYAVGEKEEAKEYLEKLNPILSQIDEAYRNVALKVLTLEIGASKIKELINSLNSLTPPEFMEKQHKMILLALKKMEAGFRLLARNDRSHAVSMVKRSADLLKMAVNNIIAFGKKEGIIKEQTVDKQ
ncbi:MAG: hypothetical protein H8D54_02075 [Candidatus Omnitrophica bacterium]|nr:hypothetical protein [Candidatus Omnitrophota bacterium]